MPLEQWMERALQFEHSRDLRLERQLSARRTQCHLGAVETVEQLALVAAVNTLNRLPRVTGSV